MLAWSIRHGPATIKFNAKQRAAFHLPGRFDSFVARGNACPFLAGKVDVEIDRSLGLPTRECVSLPAVLVRPNDAVRTESTPSGVATRGDLGQVAAGGAKNDKTRELQRVVSSVPTTPRVRRLEPEPIWMEARRWA